MDVGSMAAIAIQLSTTGQARGLASHVVAQSGTWSGHLFAVRDSRGRDLVLAHDAFEAARLFIDIEGRDELPAAPFLMPTDAEISREDEGERFDEHARGYYVMVIEHQREMLRDVRAGFVTRLARRAAG